MPRDTRNQDAPDVRLHGLLPASRANGPGLRGVVWFQGCTLGCPGCFNPLTHDPHGGRTVPAPELIEKLRKLPGDIEGISFSGGEPFQQPEAFLALLVGIEDRNLSTLAFSGYALGEIERQPLGPAILERLDVLIAGRYVKTRRHARGLMGSTNQKIHLLTSRHTMDEVQSVPAREVVLHPDGSMTVSGLNP